MLLRMGAGFAYLQVQGIFHWLVIVTEAKPDRMNEPWYFTRAKLFFMYKFVCLFFLLKGEY